MSHLRRRAKEKRERKSTLAGCRVVLTTIGGKWIFHRTHKSEHSTLIAGTDWKSAEVERMRRGRKTVIKCLGEFVIFVIRSHVALHSLFSMEKPHSPQIASNTFALGWLRSFVCSSRTCGNCFHKWIYKIRREQQPRSRKCCGEEGKS